MCTVSWLRRESGYELLCNRDEKRTRAIAEPPAVRWLDGAGAIAPWDPEGGGTWIGVNQYGVALCLMNGANLSPREPGVERRALMEPASRGHLIPKVLGARTALEVCERVWREDLTNFADFTLVALEPGMPAALVEWNGAETAIVLDGDRYLPLSSSSLDAASAWAWRQEEFARATGDLEDITSESLRAFHAAHGDIASAYTPCMHRHDAQTVSFSRVAVGPSEVEFTYSPAALCQNVPVQVVRLHRVQ
jgi:hypothetical protein